MRVSGWLIHLTTRALAESMDVRSMIHLARRLIRNYDIYERSGFSQNISIPNKDAANQIVRDMKKYELLLDLIILLIQCQETGLGGRKYRVPHLREIINEIHKSGLIYDNEVKMFFENPRVRRTKNWGVLRENEEYIFTFLSLDIVASSSLVSQNEGEIVRVTYEDLRGIVQRAIERRNGRIWNWAGDGGLVAFYFSNKNSNAVLSAMEIIHELYLYNLVLCRLNKPIRVRMAIHSGPCIYRYDYGDIKSDTLKKLHEIETKSTPPNHATLSDTVYHMLNETIAAQLTPSKYGANTSYYSYRLKLER